MSLIATYIAPDGYPVEIEVDPTIVAEGYSVANADSFAARRLGELGSSLKPVLSMIDTLVAGFRQSVGNAPDIQVAVGLKFGIEGNIVVAKGTTEGNVSVVLKYPSVSAT
ncbi:CU044_2847 family protein [Sphingomonas sp. BIUV-7]|uniref:CU044_2847 family protein n=1 Tax=Sphingomonas natans TaxID=3063330 RepID=A0ABT8Y8T5_9SPHN|nr:CU044_2847 family protein [Sphingomonas sp. BIUV-7]MDO6414387.1 CU044_2847 family protein [Sphingomonas sp. BIUV-7]